MKPYKSLPVGSPVELPVGLPVGLPVRLRRCWTAGMRARIGRNDLIGGGVDDKARIMRDRYHLPVRFSRTKKRNPLIEHRLQIEVLRKRLLTAAWCGSHS